MFQCPESVMRSAQKQYQTLKKKSKLIKGEKQRESAMCKLKFCIQLRELKNLLKPIVVTSFRILDLKSGSHHL